MIIASIGWSQTIQQPEIQSYTFARKAFEDKLYDITIREGQDYIDKFPQGQLKDRVLYLIGLALYHQGKMSEALSPLQQLKGEHPKSSLYFPALYRLGQIHFELQKYPSAIKELKVLKKKGGASWKEPALFLLASAYQQVDNYAEAAKNFQELLTIAPKGPRTYEYYLRYGNVLFLLKDYAGAAKALRASLDNFPAPAPANLKEDISYKLGQSLFLAGRYGECADALKSYIKLYPHHKSAANAVFLLAEAYEKLEDHTEAMHAYSLIIDRFSQSRWYFPALARRGRFRFDKKDYPASIQDYTRLAKATQKSPWPALAAFMLGESYWEKRDYASAIKHYSRLIRAEDNDKYLFTAYFKRALSYYHLGDYTKTLSDLKAVAELNPGDNIKGEFLFLRGQALFQAGEYAGAIDSYQQFLVMWPQDPRVSEVLFNLGLSRKKQNDIPGAKDAWEKIIVRDKDAPQTYWAYLQLGLAYYQEFHREKAIESFAKAAEGPEPLLACESRYWLAELYSQAKEYAKGLEQLEHIFRIKVKDRSNPWLGLAYSRAGAIYEMTGDEEKARAAYQGVLRVSEDKELYTVASERLKALEAKMR